MFINLDVWHHAPWADSVTVSAATTYLNRLLGPTLRAGPSTGPTLKVPPPGFRRDAFAKPMGGHIHYVVGHMILAQQERKIDLSFQ